MKKNISVAFITLLVFTIVYAQNPQTTWRPLNNKEELFVRKLEKRIEDILLSAAKHFKGKWDTKFEVDQYMRQQIDGGQHDGRPHELRCFLNMEYLPTDAEREKMDMESDEYFRKMDSLETIDKTREAEKLRDPAFKYNIHVTVVVNYYGFMAFDTKKATLLGNRANIPSAVFSKTRTKELGTSAPILTLYLGNFKIINKNNTEIMNESFGKTKECTNVRTIIIDIQSDLNVAKNFAGKLDIEALNRIVNDW